VQEPTNLTDNTISAKDNINPPAIIPPAQLGASRSRKRSKRRRKQSKRRRL
jgi:hypothetical protein